jgi:hypothetical protein
MLKTYAGGASSSRLNNFNAVWVASAENVTVKIVRGVV